jgi:2-haloacid dehalogenase
MKLKNSYRLITFDVYAALFDIESSLTPLVSQFIKTDSLTFIREWRRRHYEYALISNSLGQGRMSFEKIFAITLDNVLIRFNESISESTKKMLNEAWLNLSPWEEAAQVLESLKEREYVMALLSNGDESHLRQLSKKLPPAFDYIFSSEAAGFYKPHPSVYALPLHKLNLTAENILHVAGSPTDAWGTKAAGLTCAWSNRKHEPHLNPNLKVDYEMENLNPLLEIL